MADSPRRRLRVAVLASGRGSNLRSLLGLIGAGHVDAQVTIVVSDRADAGALDVARKAHVPAILSLPPQPGEKALDFDARLLEALAAEALDLVVLAGYLRIVGPSVIEAYPDRIINIHPSLLPSFQGLKAVRQAQSKGVRIAGCTTHIVTADLDEGPILLQAALAPRNGETETELARRILALEHILLPRTVQLFAEGRVHVAGGQAHIQDGPSWLQRPGPDLVAGALYGEGF